MEVKINKEIRNYTESMFFGLSMRQFIFSVLAIVVAVVLYFVLKPIVGMETVSWVCILGAAPFAAIGFVTYHGMTAEQFLWAWIKSEILMPKRLTFKPTNLYYEALKDEYVRAEKDGARSENKDNKKMFVSRFRPHLCFAAKYDGGISSILKDERKHHKSKKGMIISHDKKSS